MVLQGNRTIIKTFIFPFLAEPHKADSRKAKYEESDGRRNRII